MTRDEMMFRRDLLAGRSILITGGGSGLGRVIAEGCLLLGATVHICGRRGDVLDEAAHALGGKTGGTIYPHVCDIRNADTIDAMLDSVGPLDGLVNNAAGNFLSPTEKLSPNGFDAIANIVFRGTFLVTLACGKRWLAKGTQASVVSILTTWVLNGSPFTVPSAMSKAGIHAMTQSLAVEWGGRGIRLNAIAPGSFPTEGMAARLYPGRDPATIGTDNPMRRPGRMAELANLVAYLLAPGSAYVNGQLIAIDGARYQASGGNFAHLVESANFPDSQP